MKRQNGIFATPAGSEMKVRMIGSMREKKTVGVAVALEPVVGPFQVLGRDVDQLVLLQQVEAPVVADRVGDPGADQVAEHAGGDDPEQRQFAGGDAGAGEEHDRLARHRQAGGLEQHQHEDRRQAGGADEVGPRVDDRVEEEIGDAGE